MKRLLATALLTGSFLVGAAAVAPGQTDIITLAPHTAIVPGAGAAGGDWINAPLATIGGIRNVECGTVTGNPSDRNCDFGAGSHAFPGNIILNYDIGKCVAGYDGSKHLLFVICPHQRPWFRYKPRYGGAPPRMNQ